MAYTQECLKCGIMHRKCLDEEKACTFKLHMYEPLSVLLFLGLFPTRLRHWALLAMGRWDSMNKTCLCGMCLLSVFWAWRLRHLWTRSPSRYPFLPQPCVEHTSPKKLNLRVASQENSSTFCLGATVWGA